MHFQEQPSHVPLQLLHSGQRFSVSDLRALGLSLQVVVDIWQPATASAAPDSTGAMALAELLHAVRMLQHP